MAEKLPATRLWLGRASFAGLAAALVFVHLLPIDAGPSAWAPPDVLLAVAICWSARRPDFVPPLLLAAVFLLTDLLFQRPPGLWTALVILASEGMRRRAADLRSAPFTVEWLTAALAIVAVTLGYRLILAVTVTPQAPLALTMIQMTATVAVYPVVGLLSYLVFGIRRPSPGEVDSLGHRL